MPEEDLCRFIFFHQTLPEEQPSGQGIVYKLKNKTMVVAIWDY